VAHGGGQGIVPNGEGGPMCLTPHQRNSQPEGERDKLSLAMVGLGCSQPEPDQIQTSAPLD